MFFLKCAVWLMLVNVQFCQLAKEANEIATPVDRMLINRFSGKKEIKQ